MMLSLDPSTLPANISPLNVRRALRAVCYGRMFSDSPLLSLRALDALVPPGDAARTMALQDHLAGVTWHCLEDARRHHGIAGPRFDRTSLSSLAALSMLQLDFGVGSADLETWSYLYYRYFVKSGRSLRDIAKMLSTTNRTLERRLIAGHARLAEALYHHELRIVEAARLADERPAADVMDPSHLPAPAQDGATPVNPDPHEPADAHLPPPMPTADDMTSYHAGRIAEAGRGRDRLAELIVPLPLSVEGDDTTHRSARFTSLSKILDTVSDSAVLLLGPPGSGKSTLLRWLALTLSADALAGRTDRVPIVVDLSRYGEEGPDGAPPRPLDWLAARWAGHQPDLPPLQTLMRAGRVVFLLDALNEIPHACDAVHAERLRAWKHFLADDLTIHPGNRAVLSCRTGSHRVAMSTAAFPISRVVVEGLDAEGVRALIARRDPERGQEVADAVIGGPLFDLARSPFMAALLAQPDVDVRQQGCAEVLTRSLRQALVRELAADNPIVVSSAVLTAHDRARIMNTRRWPTPWDLPEDGPLFRRLAALALPPLATERVGPTVSEPLSYAAVRAALDDPSAALILDAGHALGVLDIDLDRDEVRFAHPLWQAYFAARALVGDPTADWPPAPTDDWADALHMVAQMTPEAQGMTRVGGRFEAGQPS